MSVPSLESARQFARKSFCSLAAPDQVIRFRLCEKVDRCVQATVLSEDLEVLRTCAYLQEIGVIQSSKQKPTYSLQMAKKAYRDTLGDLDDRVIDCILNHVKEGSPNTPETELMRVCHKFVVTHYLDYMLLKSRLSPERFEKLQMKRIQAYAGYLSSHPRGTEIESALHGIHDEIRN